MVQHEILMLVAAPLLVMGRPLVPLLWALPRSLVLAAGRLWNASGWSRCWRWLTRPLSAWGFHAVVLWAWHAPLLFSWTLRSSFVHSLQHLSFFGSALLFWWAV